MQSFASSIYNIGTELEVPISTIVEILLTCADASLTINSIPSPEGGTSRRCPDTSKIRDLGFNAIVDLKQGLKLSYEWYTSQNSHGAPCLDSKESDSVFAQVSSGWISQGPYQRNSSS